MESKLLQALQNQNDGISVEHGYSKNVRLDDEDSSQSGTMNQAGPSQDSQQQVQVHQHMQKLPVPQQVQHVQQSVPKIQVLSKGQQSQKPGTSPKRSFANIHNVNPDDLAKQLLEEFQNKQNKEKGAMPRLQHQLLGPQNNVRQSQEGIVAQGREVQHQNVVMRASKPCVVTQYSPAVVQAHMQQGIMQQGLEQQQVMHTVTTVGSLQSVLPNQQKHINYIASPNVKVVSMPSKVQPQSPLLNVIPGSTTCMTGATYPQMVVKGKGGPTMTAASPGTVVQGPMSQQGSPDTVILMTQAGTPVQQQIITTAAQSPGGQLVYAVPRSGQTPIFLNKQGQLVRQRQMVRTVLLKKSHSVAQQVPQQHGGPQVLTNIQLIKPAVSLANGVCSTSGGQLRKTLLASSVSPDEEMASDEDAEEDEEFEEEQEDLAPYTNTCPTLLQEQQILSQLQEGKTYKMIMEDQDGQLLKVKWTGQRLTAVQDNYTDNVKGGGKRAVQPKNLKGNATGLHMVPQENTSVAYSGRSWQFSSSGKELTRRPLRPGSAPIALPSQGAPASSGAENTSQNNSVNVAEVKPRKKKPADSNEYAVCKRCGNMSEDYNECDYCHRAMPEDAKYYSPKLGDVEYQTDTSGGASRAIVTQQFYPQKQHSQPRILARRGPDKTRPSKRKNTEPEMVTISSTDEEEEDMYSDSLQVAGSQQMPVIQTQRSASQAQLSRRQLMEDKAGNIVNKAVHIVGKYGVLNKKAGRKKKCVEEGAAAAALEQAKAVLAQQDNEDDEDMVPESVALDARGIRIGSLRGSAYAPVMFTDGGVTLNIECSEMTVGELQIPVQDLTRVLFHPSSRLPCIFLQTTPGCTNRIRLKCGMSHKDLNPYYDPMSKDERQKFICIILNNLNKEETEKLFALFEHYDAITPLSSTLYDEIDTNTANALLAKSSGKNAPQIVIQVAGLNQPQSGLITMVQMVDTGDGQMDEEEEDDEPQDRSRSPSPPLSVFAGPIVKLFTYPPPPATGGITVTNEDLFCLNEGEFLNDVIIDFYLKYVFKTLLEDDDREKTHIFSSFFYRRLTQKAKRANEEGETPQQKRHGRVKTWTRHVDLFKKDYIIVPINESAHWYLAIICFPWMQKPELLKLVTPEMIPAAEIKKEEEHASPVASSADPSSANPSSADPSSADPTQSADTAANNQEAADKPQTCTETKDDMEKKPSQDTEEEQPPEKKTPAEESPKQKKGTPTENGTPAEESMAATKSEESPTVKEETKKSPKTAEPTCDVKPSQPQSKTILRQPCILLFDSLAGPSRSGVVRTLREYLQVEWDTKKAKTEGPRTFDKDTIKGGNPKCPQQTNYSDCGIYLLQYVESFYENPIQDYTIPMRALEHWFPEDRVRCKRQELIELIICLKSELNPSLDYDCNKDIVS